MQKKLTRKVNISARDAEIALTTYKKRVPVGGTLIFCINAYLVLNPNIIATQPLAGSSVLVPNVVTLTTILSC